MSTVEIYMVFLHVRKKICLYKIEIFFIKVTHNKNMLYPPYFIKKCFEEINTLFRKHFDMFYLLDY